MKNMRKAIGFQALYAYYELGDEELAPLGKSLKRRYFHNVSANRRQMIGSGRRCENLKRHQGSVNVVKGCCGFLQSSY